MLNVIKHVILPFVIGFSLTFTAVTLAKSEEISPMTAEVKVCETQTADEALLEAEELGFIVKKDIQGEDTVKFRQALVDLGLSGGLDKTAILDRVVYVESGPSLPDTHPDFVVLFNKAGCFINTFEETKENFNNILTQAGLETI